MFIVRMAETKILCMHLNELLIILREKHKCSGKTDILHPQYVMVTFVYFFHRVFGKLQ